MVQIPQSLFSIHFNMKILKITILKSALFLFAALTAHTAQAAELASAKVIEVIGSVSKYSADGQLSPLLVGQILKEGDSVSASTLSTAKLIFSNGSELTVEENTSVEIKKLEQAAFSGNRSYEQLQADPSRSQTLLSLNYGKLSGHVKKLQANSTFEVETPLGTAAIRGTNWSALLIYNAERGEFLFVVKNFNGLVDIISRYMGQIDYGQGNVGDKGYDSTISEDTKELIPEGYSVVIRLSKDDPLFDDLISLLSNYLPTGPTPVITPGTPGPLGDGDDDFGIIVVSPEGTVKKKEESEDDYIIPSPGDDYSEL